MPRRTAPGPGSPIGDTTTHGAILASNSLLGDILCNSVLHITAAASVSHIQCQLAYSHNDAGRLLSEMALLRAGFDLRRDVCKEMTQRREEIEPFITGIFDAYVEAMAREGIWGGMGTTISSRESNALA